MGCIDVSRDTRGVARVTMNRPETHNAFNLDLIQELSTTFLELGQDPEVRVVVLAGAGKHFSAGADVEWMRSQAEASWEQNRATAETMQAVFSTVDNCPKPVVACIQGAALGGGSGLTCVADIAIASPKAVFGFTEVRLGIIPAVISPFVLRRLGYSQARAWCLLGSRISADEALRIGLVHFVSEDLEAELERVLGELLKGAPDAHSHTKELLRQVWDTSWAEQAPLTAQATAVARASAQGREGLAAFLEKRPPNWA